MEGYMGPTETLRTLVVGIGKSHYHSMASWLIQRSKETTEQSLKILILLTPSKQVPGYPRCRGVLLMRLKRGPVGLSPVPGVKDIPRHFGYGYDYPKKRGNFLIIAMGTFCENFNKTHGFIKIIALQPPHIIVNQILNTYGDYEQKIVN